MVELNRNFKYAIRDLVWLLDRGYPKKSAIDLVGNRYMLDRNERQILLRGVFDKATCNKRREKLLNIEGINISSIIIDGLNVLISIHSYLMGRIVFRALDGFVRDISGVYGKFSYSDKARKALEFLIRVLLILLKIQERNIKVYLFFDYNASMIGDFAHYVRETFQKNGMVGEVIVDKNCDFLIIEKIKSTEANCLVATSDTVIIDKVNSVVDIPALVIEKLLKKKILDLKKISGIKLIG